jgi:hypothetical protein
MHRAAISEIEQIARNILVLRRQRVIVDRDLGEIYGVSTARLNEAVKRNAERFPTDFIFRVTTRELVHLRSQIATPSWGGRRYRPFVFTEHGAIQAANVLNSPRAVAMGVHVVRAFVQLRELLASNKELARRFAQLKSRLDKKLTDHDATIDAILSAIRQLMNPAAPRRRPIGFTANLNDTT